MNKSIIAILILSIFAPNVLGIERCSWPTEEERVECMLSTIEAGLCWGVDINGCGDTVTPFDANGNPYGCNTMCGECLACLDNVGGACCLNSYINEDLPLCNSNCINRYPNYP